MKAIKHELEWVRQNPKGRQAKSKARIARFEELSSVEYQQRNETNEIFIPVAERLGNDVIEFNHVSKASATACSSTTCRSASPPAPSSA